MHSELPPTPLREITEFTRQITSIPSVESERAIATCVAEKLTTLEFEPHLIGDLEHPSVICHYQAATATKTRGWLRLKLATYGKAAHTGSHSRKGTNAVHALIRAALLYWNSNWKDRPKN